MMSILEQSAYHAIVAIPAAIKELADEIRALRAEIAAAKDKPQCAAPAPDGAERVANGDTK
jgi:hypothetical protein